MSTIAIQVDDIIIKKFLQATEQEKARWEDAFNLWWRVYFIDNPQQKLALVVDCFRQKAQERGLTQEELDKILAEDGNE